MQMVSHLLSSLCLLPGESNVTAGKLNIAAEDWRRVKMHVVSIHSRQNWYVIRNFLSDFEKFQCIVIRFIFVVNIGNRICDDLSTKRRKWRVNEKRKRQTIIIVGTEGTPTTKAKKICSLCERRHNDFRNLIRKSHRIGKHLNVMNCDGRHVSTTMTTTHNDIARECDVLP